MTPSIGCKNKTEKPPKLRRLPKSARIQKRPLLHPAIPSPYTNASQLKVIYVSSHTPFISAVKRVRKLLSLIDKRSTSSAHLVNDKKSDKQRLQSVAQGRSKEEVLLKATGKAIEKVLGLGLFFQGQEDLKVSLRTGGVGAIDDIVEVDEKCKRRGKQVDKKKQGVDEDVMVGDMEVDKKVDEEEELPETQIRMTGMVEVRVCLR